jgi:hypothetical protein
MSTSNNYGNNSRESHHRVVEHKKYVKDQKYVRDRGVESTIYVTAVDGIVKKYVIKSVSRSDPGSIGCRNRHLGTLRNFERYFVHEKHVDKQYFRHGG